MYPHLPYTEADKERIIRAYYERPSMRGIERVFRSGSPDARGVVKKKPHTPAIEATLVPARPDDRLELDEIGSFVYKRSNKRWLWTALARRTRQIVAFVIGDRSEQTGRQLWERIPAGYRTGHSFSDFWEAYALVFPKETHRCVGKGTGETYHVERWNNTLRPSNARYVRKTLSFSKSDFYHELVTRLLIVR